MPDLRETLLTAIGQKEAQANQSVLNGNGLQPPEYAGPRKKNGPRFAFEAGTVLFCCILMYRAFADAEFLRGGADRGPVFDDVLSQALRPLLHIFLQHTTLPASCWSSVCGQRTGYV